jgi:hypothetical protein
MADSLGVSAYVGSTTCLTSESDARILVFPRLRAVEHPGNRFEATDSIEGIRCPQE